MKMKCDVIKDLMPSYIDQLLTEESRILVEEHLEECEACKAYYDSLKGEDDIFDAETAVELHLEEIKPLKKIKKKMNRKTMLVSVLSVLCAVAIGYGVLFALTQIDSYVPYEDAGIRVSETGEMYVDEKYSSTWGYTSADGIKFIYFTDSFVTRDVERTEEEKNKVNDDFMNAQGVHLADDDTYQPSIIYEVYYLGEEYVEKMNDRDFMVSIDEKVIDDMKSVSKLLWERPVVMEKTGNLKVRFTAKVEALIDDPNVEGGSPRYVVARVFQSNPIIFDGGLTLARFLEVGESYTFNMELAMVENLEENYSLDTLISLYDLRLESYSVVDEALTGLNSVDVQYEPF